MYAVLQLFLKPKFSILTKKSIEMYFMSYTKSEMYKQVIDLMPKKDQLIKLLKQIYLQNPFSKD